MKKEITVTSRPAMIAGIALVLAGCTAAEPNLIDRYGYDKRGYGPYGYTENYWQCGEGGACGPDYGFGHGYGFAGPPVDH
jgi:hypothetical protein